MVKGMRLMVYDRTCTGVRGRGLSEVWWAGALLYEGLGRFDAWKGVASWAEAFDWLATFRAGAPIAQVQFWGHGNWGVARVGADRFDQRSLEPGHDHHRALRRIHDRLAPGASWWFRTCDTFGADRGHRFAQGLTELLGCNVAGHTYILGPWHSGLHRLSPGAAPHWPATEGLAEGEASHPVRSSWSWPGRPNTITFLDNHVPDGW